MDATSAPRRSWADGPIAPALLAAAAVLAFLPSLSGVFVFDDVRFITANPHVQRPDWLAFFTDGNTIDPKSPQGIVRPLRTTDFALDRALFGNESLAFHLHSVAWHLLAVVTLLLVLRRLVGDPRIAFVGALVWAVHPVQVESVAWISSRGDVACGALTLVATLFALRSRGFDRDLAVSLAAAALAPLYKETGVAIPIAIALLRWTRSSRAPVWPYVAVAGAYLVYRQIVKIGDTGHGMTFVLGGGTAGTFATMIRAFGFYVVETLLPAESLDWYMPPSTGLADAAVLGWLAVHAVLVGSALRMRVRAPLWTLAVGWFYVFLLPVANWPFFLGIPTTERFLYLPLAGLVLALCVGLSLAPRAGWWAALVAAVALGGAAAHRSGMWIAEEPLWHTVLADHESPRGRAFLGERLRERGIALAARAAATPVGPERDAAAAEVTKVFEESLSYLHRSLDLWYGFEMTGRSRAYFAQRSELNASDVARRLGRPGEALFHADQAIESGGLPLPEPYYDRALALLDLGFAPQAMASMRKYRELKDEERDDVLGGFFVRAAAKCEADGLLETAEAGYRSAIDASPPGVLRGDAEARFVAVQARPRPSGAAEKERARIGELDADLARLPRTCPARREYSVQR